jgi:hypothetical protein
MCEEHLRELYSRMELHLYTQFLGGSVETLHQQ